MNVRPCWIIEPQLGLGGSTPKPSRLSPASAISAAPIASDTATISGDATFGSTRLRRTRPGFVPIDRDASMNVSWRTASVCARTSRANPGITTIAIASTAFSSPGPRIPTTASASTSGGKLARRVHDPHEDVVGAATAEAREQPDGHRREQRQEHDLESGAERHARPVDDPAEGVAPEAVGAERCVPTRARERRRDADLVRRVRRDERREHGGEQDEQEERQRDDRRLVAEQPPERAPPRVRRAASPRPPRRTRCRRPPPVAGSRGRSSGNGSDSLVTTRALSG